MNASCDATDRKYSFRHVLDRLSRQARAHLARCRTFLPQITMARAAIIGVLIACVWLRGNRASEPDYNMKVPDMIRLRGYEAEVHHVVTEDCHRLELHRIVKANRDPDVKRRPILFVHGLMGSSAEWIMNSVGGHVSDADNRSLAFYLARDDYDVWLGNNRGNEYSDIYKGSVRSP
jgi:pimeloyl-ACP methyl ester carboxylesterase